MCLAAAVVVLLLQSAVIGVMAQDRRAAAVWTKTG
jgi:hypothetical protein